MRLDQVLVAALTRAAGAAGNLPEQDEDEFCADEDLLTLSSQARPLSREAVKKAVYDGCCQINGRICLQPATKVRTGDSVVISLSEEGVHCPPEEGDIDVVWHDDDIIVLNKQVGIVVHPCTSCPSGTLVQRVLGVYPDMTAMNGLRPGIVHRLDRQTSGLMLMARNEATRLSLSEAFSRREVHKTYLALTYGVPGMGSVKSPLGRDPFKKRRRAVVPLSQGGREAWTDYETLWSDTDKKIALVRLGLHTGRTHQIRVHMRHIGHPLLGDTIYGDGPFQEAASMAPRVMLHAWRLGFVHPHTGRRLTFTLPPPADFADYLSAAAAQTQCLVLTGNPGCGKSTVLALFAQNGCPVISADNLVNSYYRPGGALSAWIGERAGEDTLDADGGVDKKALMVRLQEAPSLRYELERVVHTLVRGDIQAFFDDCRTKRTLRCCAEIPLYFECGWHKDAFAPKPLVLGVRADQATRRARLAETRGWSADKSAAIENWQWPEDRKMAACDMVLDNMGDHDALRRLFAEKTLPALDALIDESACSFTQQMKTFWGDGLRIDVDGMEEHGERSDDSAPRPGDC